MLGFSHGIWGLRAYLLAVGTQRGNGKERGMLLEGDEGMGSEDR